MSDAVQLSALVLAGSAVIVWILDYLAQTRGSETLETWADRAHKFSLLVALGVVIALGVLIVRVAWVGR
ncbi:MAG: hypothetical protein KDA51_14865 [Planctomycetales bacterium]|nr:hypothetical protein [Planctomycetales bacterium]